MNLRLLPLRLVAILVTAVGWLPANSQTTTNSDNSIPLIVMESMPLTDAIRNLARQEEMNLIFDPVLSGSSLGSDGKFFKQPFINARWENLTPRQAIDRLVKEHKLELVENPATSVARITFAGQGARPVDASRVVGDTNKIVPVMRLDGLSLGETLNQLAGNVGIQIELDPKLPDSEVWLRWEKISPAQALAALIDGYNLEMTKNAEGGKFRIAPKPKTDAKPVSPEKPKATKSDK